MKQKQELPKSKIRENGRTKIGSKKRRKKEESTKRGRHGRETWKMYQRRKKIKSTSLDSANTPHAEVPPPAELLGRYVLVEYEEIKALSSYRG